jgi:hypothetical protein
MLFAPEFRDTARLSGENGVVKVFDRAVMIAFRIVRSASMVIGKG